MNKTFAIIGAVLFIVAVVVAKFVGFDAAIPVSIGIGAFSFAAIVAGAVSGAKEKKIATWKTVIVVVGSTAGGILFFVGGVSQDVLQQISGIVLTLLSIILGITVFKPEAEKKGLYM